MDREIIDLINSGLAKFHLKHGYDLSSSRVQKRVAYDSDKRKLDYLVNKEIIKERSRIYYLANKDIISIKQKHKYKLRTITNSNETEQEKKDRINKRRRETYSPEKRKERFLRKKELL